MASEIKNTVWIRLIMQIIDTEKLIIKEGIL
ncbi:hypothetical protein ANME2D_01626 [Candidatus Methanoperedens nitroreducens]|uniref:Uncharacterized protein n=1 Tax=Candidatus Methanoperedens nitratireducens TaxID=1392998 RepID=A0A062V4E3_9EURY|nr:hypothetical protein ANME2D_01626 [Candidatus Methanoperedens nitroreducens]